MSDSNLQFRHKNWLGIQQRVVTIFFNGKIHLNRQDRASPPSHIFIAGAMTTRHEVQKLPPALSRIHSCLKLRRYRRRNHHHRRVACFVQYHRSKHLAECVGVCKERNTQNARNYAFDSFKTSTHAQNPYLDLLATTRVTLVTFNQSTIRLCY